jgi:hypothetical protein
MKLSFRTQDDGRQLDRTPFKTGWVRHVAGSTVSRRLKSRFSPCQMARDVRTRFVPVYGCSSLRRCGALCARATYQIMADHVRQRRGLVLGLLRHAESGFRSFSIFLGNIAVFLLFFWTVSYQLLVSSGSIVMSCKWHISAHFSAWRG